MEGHRGLANAAPARLTVAEGRRFAFTVGIAFLVLAVTVAWRGHTAPATILGVLAALFVSAGIIVPRRLAPIQRGWMALAIGISRVTTPIVMGVVYFLVLTPTGLLRRALGRNPLKPRTNGTLWFDRATEERGDLTRQF